MSSAVILAGGKGTRLKEMVSDVPKPLAPIQGVPFLDLLIEYIERTGIIKKIVLAIGYKGEMLFDRYQKRHGKIPIEFSIETQPLGTGGALVKAMQYIDTKNFFVFNGDSFFSCSLETMLSLHNQTVTIACAHVEDTRRFGKVEVQSINGKHRILSFLEKSLIKSKGWINSGIYLFEKTVFDQNLPAIFSLEKDLLPKLVEREIIGFLSEGFFLDIGTKESYLLAQILLMKFIKPPSSP